MTTYVSYTETGAAFSDGTTLSGSWTAEYDDNDNLIAVNDVNLVATSADGSKSTTFTGSPGVQSGGQGTNTAPNGTTFYQVLFNDGSNNNNYYNLYLDWTGTGPTSLSSGQNQYTSIVNNAAGTGTIALTTGGSVTNYNQSITTTVTGAQFNNGATLAGNWTTVYDSSGNIVGINNLNITVTNPDGSSSTFTSAYATGGAPDASGVYQILAGGTSGGPFGYLYIDWTGQSPTALEASADGAGNYTSVALANADGSTTTLQLTNGGTASDVTACFVAGTRIRTTRGDVAVESLAPDDLVVLHDGNTLPVRWVGFRTLRPGLFGRPDVVSPILIERGAFGQGRPSSDLTVSPDHGFYFEGHLIPAKALLTGTNIRQLSVRSVTYYHVELETHAILIANGAEAESYLDTGNRGSFTNGDAVVVLRPDLAQQMRETTGCFPFVEAGPVVEAVRAQVLARASLRLTRDPDLRIVYEGDHAIVASRAARPGLVTTDPRDRRVLGVKVAELRVGGTIVPLDHPALKEGWYDLEPDGRWTNGAAIVPASLRQGHDVTVQVAATIPYSISLAG